MCTQVWAWMTNKCRTKMVKKELYNVREQPQEGGTEIPLRVLFNEFEQKPISSDGELVSSDHESIQLYVPGSYSMVSNICVNRCQTHRSLALEPTLYKFIVLGLLGPDPIRLGAQSKNRDRTITITWFKLYIF